MENREVLKVPEGYEIEIVEDIENRTFSIIGEIEEDLVNRFDEWKQNLSELESPITLQIHSPGGCVNTMLAVIGMMEDFKEIHGVVLGSCSSAALGIFVHCHNREMKKYATCMHHEISYGMEGKVSKHVEQIKSAKELQEIYNKMISEASNIPIAKLRRNRKDWYMDRKECIENGIVNVD